jgi:hypothetical protein
MPPGQAGYVLQVTRTSTQARTGIAYRRTVGAYAIYWNGQPTGLSGSIVERQGPGDNTETGVKAHRRIAAGTYPLLTHISPVKNGQIKYRTIGYQTTGAANAIPRPCLEVGETGLRSGILVHPAAGFLMSIGCFNPSGPLASGDTNLTWADSKARVVALIDDLRAKLGPAFPTQNNVRIPNTWIVVEGEP